MEPVTKKMKAVILEQDLSLSVKEVDIPKPGPGEVLVKVESAPINPSDLAFLTGNYASDKKRPCVPGFEGSGIVVQNGGGLMGWSLVGKRVAIFSSPKSFTGTYGQYCVTDQMACLPIQESLSFDAASMSFVNPLTCIVMLEKAQQGKHKAIIHTAAAGALGRMMIRYFNSHNIPIINIVRRQEQADLLKSEGAKYILLSEEPDFEEKLKQLSHALEATLCFDAVGGKMTAKLVKNMPKRSKVQVYGLLSMEPKLSEIDLVDILFNEKEVKGFFLGLHMEEVSMVSKLLYIKKVRGLLKSDLKSEISERFEVSKFKEALEYYKANMTKGKVIIKPWGLEEGKDKKEGN